MLPNLKFLKNRLQDVILCKEKQGFDTAGMLTKLKKLPDSYDAVAGLAQKIADLPFRMPSAFGFFGIVLFLISIWLLHRSHADLGRLWSPTVEPETQQRLVTDGVYKRSRHPMYAAHVLWGLAQALLLPNLIAGPLALLLMLGVISLRVPREEHAMLKEFGDDYRKYIKTTGCILPKLNA